MSVRSLAGQPTTGGTTRCSTDAFGAVERTRSAAEESSTTGGRAHSRASPTGWPSGPWGSRSRSGRSRSLAGPCTLTEPEFPIRHDARPRLLARPHRPLLECDAGVHVAPNRGALPGFSARGDRPTASGGFDGRIERLHTPTAANRRHRTHSVRHAHLLAKSLSIALPTLSPQRGPPRLVAICLAKAELRVLRQAPPRLERQVGPPCPYEPAQRPPGGRLGPTAPRRTEEPAVPSFPEGPAPARGRQRPNNSLQRTPK